MDQKLDFTHLALADCSSRESSRTLRAPISLTSTGRIGIFMLGATQGRGHWMGPVVSLFVIALGIYTIYLVSRVSAS